MEPPRSPARDREGGEGEGRGRLDEGGADRKERGRRSSVFVFCSSELEMPVSFKRSWNFWLEGKKCPVRMILGILMYFSRI